MRIRAEHIDFTYRTGKGSHAVLEDVSLAIAPGETVGLLGPSGCGKSTLGKILCGRNTPAFGNAKTHEEIHLSQQKLPLHLSHLAVI